MQHACVVFAVAAAAGVGAQTRAPVLIVAVAVAGEVAVVTVVDGNDRGKPQTLTTSNKFRTYQVMGQPVEASTQSQNNAKHTTHN